MLLQLEGRAITPSTYKLHEKPRNHMNVNCTKIKQLMKKVKEREQAKQEPVKVLWKSDQYKNVQSKLKEMLEVCYKERCIEPLLLNIELNFLFIKKPPMAPREPNKDFLRARSRTGSIASSRPQSARPAPKENETEAAQVCHNINRK